MYVKTNMYEQQRGQVTSADTQMLNDGNSKQEGQLMETVSAKKTERNQTCDNWPIPEENLGFLIDPMSLGKL